MCSYLKSSVITILHTAHCNATLSNPAQLFSLSKKQYQNLPLPSAFLATQQLKFCLILFLFCFVFPGRSEMVWCRILYWKWVDFLLLFVCFVLFFVFLFPPFFGVALNCKAPRAVRYALYNCPIIIVVIIISSVSSLLALLFLFLR